MTTKPSAEQRDRDPGRSTGHRLPSELRGSRLWLGVAVASVVFHVGAFATLSGLRRPAPTQAQREERIPLPPQPKRSYQVRVVPPKAKTAPAPNPEPRRTVAPVTPARPAAPRVARRAARPARTTPARAQPKPGSSPPASAPVLDLTQASAGVTPGLTAGSGPGGFNLGSTAVGDPNGPPGATGSGGGQRAPAPGSAPASSPAPAPTRDRSALAVVKRMPEVLAVPKASYPDAAKRKRVEGTVRLLVTVDPRGRVVSVRVLAGLGYGLDEAAVSALKRARFRPALGSDDRPLSYSIRYRYTFRLEG